MLTSLLRADEFAPCRRVCSVRGRRAGKFAPCEEDVLASLLRARRGRWEGAERINVYLTTEGV